MKKWIFILAVFAIFTFAMDKDTPETLSETHTASDVENPSGFYARADELRLQDGDGFTIGNKRFRLLCIDAPEKDQPYGDKATMALAKLVKNGAYIHPRGDKDINKRDLVMVIVNIDGTKINANYEMIRQGHAWVHRAYAKTCGLNEKVLYALQSKAKAEKRGLWKDPNPIEPLEWKKHNKRNK